MNRPIAFVSLPAHGHVTPTLPLVADLVRRGWRVSYATAETFAPEVGRAGATLVPTAARPPRSSGPGGSAASAVSGFVEWIGEDARIDLPRWRSTSGTVWCGRSASTR